MDSCSSHLCCSRVTTRLSRQLLKTGNIQKALGTKPELCNWSQENKDWEASDSADFFLQDSKKWLKEDSEWSPKHLQMSMCILTCGDNF